jgi:hypothetical protein
MLKRWIPLWVIPVVLVMAIGTVWLRLAIIRTTYAINQAGSSCGSRISSRLAASRAWHGSGSG